MSKWNTTKLIVAGALAVVWLFFSLFSSALQAVTGIVGFAGIIGMFTSSLIFAFAILLLKKFGTGTIMGLIYGILALPLATMGTPGFLPKIIIATSAGLAADAVFIFLRRKEKIAAVVIGSITQLVIPFEILGFSLLLSVPGLETLAKSILSPLVIIIPIGGAIGGFLGYLLYQKLKNTAVVKRIQG